MKKLIHKTLNKISSVYSHIRLPSYYGTYWITPKPKYFSQFVSIYPASITPKKILTNKKDIKEFGAKDGKEFTFWAWRDCGIACVKMILATKNKAKKKTIMELTKEGVELGGYILYKNGKFVDEGWFHRPLSRLLRRNGVIARTKKWQSIESVASDILRNRLVILSLKLPSRPTIKEDGSFEPKKNAEYTGHLVLATGVKMNGKNVEGIFVHDPRGLKKYQKNTWIPYNTLNKVFTNRTVVTD
ncbi:MAG TPA: C39 family peptidase [Candidatus Dojkabacteria bacterium]|nr:C39 family peptidase [Candidatus Dojkabacteria bacterium]